MDWTAHCHQRAPFLKPYGVAAPFVHRQQRVIRSFSVSPVSLLDSPVVLSQSAEHALEVARANGLAHSASAWHLLQWSFCFFSVIPFVGFILGNGLPVLQKHMSKKNLEKEEMKSHWLYGVDVSRSRFLKKDTVEKAVHFAERAHHGQKRKTGDPYITHCLHTALILENLLTPSQQDARCEMAMICAVLHDVLDDTKVEYSDVECEFGSEIATAVLQISEMSSTFQQLRRHNCQKCGDREMDREEKKEQDKKLMTAILKRLKDPLILAVKLADRLHNLRTIYVLRPEKQKAVANETLRVFCGLAENLGFFSLKAEMEDLCFCVLQPNEFWNVYQKVQLTWKSEKSRHPSPDTAPSIPTPEVDISQKHCKELLQLVTPFTAVHFSCQRADRSVGFGLEFLRKRTEQLLFEIKMLSFSAGLEIDVIGRVKSVYSTYRKMQKKRIPVHEVFDVLGLRVIVMEDGDQELAQQVCYKILSLVQYLWKQFPSELDDYIAAPKRSGYQSLHVAVRGPGDIPFEVQIRTASMDESAEYGHAAHWCYKECEDVSSATASTSLTMRDSIWGASSRIIGHPVVRIRDGQWRDGIVIRVEDSGLSIIVAVNILDRMSRSFGSYTFAVRKSYETLLEYVNKKKWFDPGSGDFRAVIERYVLCSDQAYHLIDNFGHRHPTIVRPISVFDSDTSLETHLRTLDAGRQGNSTALSQDEREMQHHGLHLRTMLDSPDGHSERPKATNVHVMLWPAGKVQTFPCGTTVADVMAAHNGHSSTSEGPEMDCCLVHVNNRLVQSDTLLQDGDNVVLKEVQI